MKIYDCFTYNGEQDLLQIRLHELGDAIDFFIICEASTTFTNKQHEIKELELPAELEIYRHKIRHIKVLDMPMNIDPWINESFLRNSIKRGLEDANENDIIIIGDADEILRRDTIKNISFSFQDLILGFKLNLYYFYFDYRCVNGPEAECIWNIGSHYKTIQDVDLHKLRYETRAGIRETNSIADAGWHFSYFLDHAETIKKIENFSHQEYNNKDFIESINIRSIVTHKKDLYSRNEFIWDIIIDKSLPLCVSLNKKFHKFFFTKDYENLLNLYGKSLNQIYNNIKSKNDLILEVEVLRSINNESSSRITYLESKCESLTNSLSWKLSFPLRKIDSILRAISNLK
jgi:hypothetical protein